MCLHMKQSSNTHSNSARLKLVGATPKESEWVKNVNNIGASSVVQLSNNEDGMSSGPAAELGEGSCMASIIFFQIIQYQLNIFQ